MKKTKINAGCLSVLALFGFTLGLSSCKEETSSSSFSSELSSSGESSSSSSEKPDGHFEKWTNRDLMLMKQYCDGTLPYSFPSKPSVSVQYDSNSNGYYLEFVYEDSSFSMKEYYKELAKFDWNVITTYSGEAVQTNTSGIEYVEATKGNEDTGDGYDMIYYFYPEETDDDGNITSGDNIIRVYSDLYGLANKDSSWNEDTLYAIDYVTTTTLPFIKMGEVYAAYTSDYDTLQIYDKYYKNITADYAKLLIADGFTLNEKDSNTYDAYILNKTLADGSEIDALLYYNSGNNFNFYYTAKEITYSSWPTDVVNEIKEKTGETLPKFDIAEGGKYNYYKKGNIYFLYTLDLSDDFDYEEYALNQLQNPKLLWNEKISFKSYDMVDDDYQTIGYRVVVSVTDPTSTFVSSYPSDAISDVLTNLLGISGVDYPTFDFTKVPSTGKQAKYSIQGEEYYNAAYQYYYEDIVNYPSFYGLDDDATLDDAKALASKLAKAEEGITLSILDVDMQAYDSYEEALNKAGWYEYYDAYNNSVFEDPTGTLAITLSGYSSPSLDDEGVTTFFFHPGSGTAHKAVFSFEESEVEIAVGGEKQLYVTKKMLPYEITYSSSDETGGISVDSKGNVTVADTVEDGTTAIITASVQVPGESTPRTTTCKVTARKMLIYTPNGVVASLAKIAQDLGYEASITPAEHDDQNDTLSINFGSSLTKDEIKEIVESKLILDGFKTSDSWDDDSFFVIDNGTPDGIEVTSSYIVYGIENDSCYVLIQFDLYEYNGNMILNVYAY